MSVTIRLAKETDAEAISTLVISLSHYFIPELNSPDVRPFLETLTPAATAERIKSEAFRCYVAEKGNKICGVIAVRDNTHIYHLFVHSQMHRQGVAGALWEHIRTNSESQVFTVNSSLFAVPIYERFGFKAVKQPQEADGLVFVPMEFRHR